MKFNTKDIKARAKEDFEKTWNETANLLPEKSTKDYTSGTGKAHTPACPHIRRAKDTHQPRLHRNRKLSLHPGRRGLLAVWAGSPCHPRQMLLPRRTPPPGHRPRQSADREDTRNQKGRRNRETKGDIQEIPRGAIEGDNLLEEMIGQLGVSAGEAAKIIDIFPEFRNLNAVAEKTTLRSHMTAGWFPTLKAIAEKKRRCQ